MAATIIDVAKLAGVSIGTVSKYINSGDVKPRNRQSIQMAIEQLDYSVNPIARGLKTNKTMTVGVLISDLESPFFSKVVSATESILSQCGYSTIICDYHGKAELEAEKLAFLAGRHIDGLIFAPGALSREEDLISKMKATRDVPIVILDQDLGEYVGDLVMSDHFSGPYVATQHLLDRGHRRIGFISGKKDVYSASERLRGYVAAHEELGLVVDEAYVRMYGFKVAGGYRSAMELLQGVPRPTALLPTSYGTTIGALMAINERGLSIPGDISLIGFDEDILAKVYQPALSIVRQPIGKIGEQAARILLKRMRQDFEGFPLTSKFPMEFVSADSVAVIGK